MAPVGVLAVLPLLALQGLVVAPGFAVAADAVEVEANYGFEDAGAAEAKSEAWAELESVGDAVVERRNAEDPRVAVEEDN